MLNFFLKAKKHFFKITIGLLVLTFVTLESFFHSNVTQFLEKRILTEVTKLNIPLTFKTVDYKIIPPTLVLKGVHYKTTNILSQNKRVSVSIKMIPLIKGKISLNKLLIDGSTSSINELKQKKKSRNLSFDGLLDEINKNVPFEQIQVKNSRFILLLKDGSVLQTLKTGLTLKKVKDKVNAELSTEIEFKNKNIEEKSINLQAKLNLQEEKFFINYFNIQKNDSILQTSGSLSTDILQTPLPKLLNLNTLFPLLGEVRLKGDINLSDINNTASFYLHKNLTKIKKIPLSGNIQFSGYFNELKANNESLLNFSAKDIRSPFIKFEKALFKAVLDKRSFSSNKVSLDLQDGGVLEVHNFKLLRQNKALLVAGDLKTKKFRVEELLSSLNLNVENLKAPVSLDAHCGGSLSPDFKLRCEGNSSLKSLTILLPKGKKLISTKSLKAPFKGTITKSDFIFSAKPEYQTEEQRYKGSVSGIVNYVKGFDVAFETPLVNLSFLNEIAGQSLKGNVSIKGKTKGSSRWGELNLAVNGKDLHFNELTLGSAEGKLVYKNPFLTIKNIKGSFKNSPSKYQGDIVLEAKENKLSIDVFGSDFSDNEARLFFHDLFTLPKEISFNSKKFHFNSSEHTDINLSNLILKADFNNLSLFNEKFEAGKLFISGKEGKWDIKEGVLKKGPALITSSGHLDGFKEIHARVLSSSLDLKQLNFLNKQSKNFSGPIKMTLNAEGPLDGPKAVGTIQLKNTIGVKGVNLGDSDLGYRLYNQKIFLKGDAFNNKVNGEGVYPFSPEESYSFSGKIKNLDLFNLMNLNSSESNIFSFPLSLVTNNDETSQKDSLFRKIDSLSLNIKKLDKKLLEISKAESSDLPKNQQLYNIKSNEKMAQLKATFLKNKEVDLNFLGFISLEFLKPFIPTCELVNGQIEFQDSAWRLKNNSLKGKGFAELYSGTFKSSEFPYHLNNINGKFNIVNDLINISDLNSKLNNSVLHSQGSVKASPFYLDIKTKYKNLLLNFPEKIQSTTNGNLHLYGEKLPLTLSGNIYAAEGAFTKDLLTGEERTLVTPSKHLPKKILVKSAPPVDLNLIIKIAGGYKLITNEVLGSASGKLFLKGSPVNPKTNGLITLKKDTKIFFLDKTFKVNEGGLTYKNHYINDPLIFMDTVAEVKDNNDLLEKIYKVRMIIQGQSSDPNVSFTSSPVLSEKEIISLLTLGTVSTQTLGQEITSKQQVTYSGLQFGSYLLQKNQAIRDLQKQTGLQIGLSSSVDSLSVNPKIEVKKNWSPRLSSTASQTFGNRRTLAVNTEYKFNNKVSSVFSLQNTQTQDASQLINRRTQEGRILELDLQYKFEFD